MSDTTLCSKHFDDYRSKILAEFKLLYWHSKNTKNTHILMSNLNEYDLTPPSLKTKPPNLNIEHEKLNNDIEFDTLIKPYNKELTLSYIKILDFLAIVILRP